MSWEQHCQYVPSNYTGDCLFPDALRGCHFVINQPGRPGECNTGNTSHSGHKSATEGAGQGGQTIFVTYTAPPEARQARTTAL
jgi:hypothetical protein